MQLTPDARLPQAAAPQRQRTRIDALVLMLMFGVLLIVLPYDVFQDINVYDWSAELLTSVGILVYAGLRLSWIAAQGRPRLVLITFYSFIYVWVGLAATAQLVTGRWPLDVVHMFDDILPTLMTIVVFIACVELGYLSINWRRRDAQPPRLFQGMSFSVSDRAAAWLTVAAFGLSVIGIVVYGPSHLFVTRAEADAYNMSFGGKAYGMILERVLRVPSLVAFTVVAYNGLRRWRRLTRSRKQFYFLMSFLLLALMLVTNYPPSLSRVWAGTVILTPLFALLPWRRIFAPGWIFALTFVLTIVFPYLDIFRNTTSIDEAFDQLEVQSTTLEPLLTGHYDAFQQTINGYGYVEKYDVLMGRNLLGAALFWFPRSIWTDKPLGTGMMVANSVHYAYTNLSSPLWMEFYMAFGWIGLIVMALMYGRGMGAAERLYEAGLAAHGQDHLSRVLVPYWAAFQIFLLRGDLINSFAFSTFGLVMFLLAALPSRVRLGSGAKGGDWGSLSSYERY